jgi:hypothetical protein
VAGDGGRRTVTLTTQAGVAIVNGSTTMDTQGIDITTTYAAGGPALGFGVEWRL